jgi:hypothetical protein
VPRRDGAPRRADCGEADVVVPRGTAPAVNLVEDVAWEVGPPAPDAAVPAVAGHWFVLAMVADGIVCLRYAKAVGVPFVVRRRKLLCLDGTVNCKEGLRKSNENNNLALGLSVRFTRA